MILKKKCLHMSRISSGRKGRQSVTQLAAITRRQIAAGTWRPGDKLPVMRELAVTYAVSIGTVRRAVLLLEQEGLLTRRWGSGCFVTHPTQPASTDANASGHTTEQPTHNPLRSVKPGPSGAGISVSTSNSVVILLPYDGHFYDRFTMRLCELANQRGLTPVKLAPPRHYDSKDWSHLLEYFEQLRDHPPAAVIANTIPSHLGRVIEDVCATRSKLIGVMMADGPTRPHLWHRIMSQTAILGDMAAEQLYEMGHRRVGLITNVRRILPDKLPRSIRKHTYGHTELILALGRGLRQRGGPGMLSVFYNQQVPQASPQPFGSEELQRMADFLLKPNCPTALIGQDFRLVAAIQAWKLAGLPEQDMPLMLGIGNTPWAHQAGFDSYCHQPEVMADHANSLLDSPPAPLVPVQKIRVAPRFISHAQGVTQDVRAMMLP